MWDFIMEYIMPIIIVIFLLIMLSTIPIIIFWGVKYRIEDTNYIQNIETKLNIYETKEEI